MFRADFRSLQLYSGAVLQYMDEYYSNGNNK